MSSPKLLSATAFAAMLSLSVPAQGETSDQLVDGTISAVVTGSMIAGATAGCGLAGSVVGIAPGIGAAFVCAAVADHWSPYVVEFTHSYVITDREIDETAAWMGRLIGNVAGAGAGALTIKAMWLGNFARYSTSVRALTAKTYRSFQDVIDPQSLRGLGHDLDHKLSIGCGWLLGLPARVMASTWNLQMLPSSINRSLGSACR
jgi:hypothetical protein